MKRRGRLLSALIFVLALCAVQAQAARDLLTADRTYYVRSDGDDDNTGLANNATYAWATLQHAADVVAGTIDCGNYTIKIKVTGTFSHGVKVFGPFVGGNITSPYGCVLFSGDTANPANAVLALTNENAFISSFGARYGVEGFKITTSGSGDGLYASAKGQFYVNGAMESGAMGGGSSAIHAGFDGAIVGVAPWTVSGNVNVVLYGDRGKIEYISSLFTMVNTPHFAAFAYAHEGGLVYLSGNTYSGAATGWKGYADLTGALDTVGQGVINLPGDTYVSPATGGQYN